MSTETSLHIRACALKRIIPLLRGQQPITVMQGRSRSLQPLRSVDVSGRSLRAGSLRPRSYAGGQGPWGTWPRQRPSRWPCRSLVGERGSRFGKVGLPVGHRSLTLAAWVEKCKACERTCNLNEIVAQMCGKRCLDRCSVWTSTRWAIAQPLTHIACRMPVNMGRSLTTRCRHREPSRTNSPSTGATGRTGTDCAAAWGVVEQGMRHWVKMQ